MTREEAIEVIKEYRDNLIISPSNQLDGDVKAFDMAIKALSQEPCTVSVSEKEPNEITEEVTLRFFKNSLKVRWHDFVIYNVEWLKKNWQMEMDIVCGVKPCDDAISRDMALEKMADYVASGYADSAEDFEEYSRIICQLPSVTQKSGKWNEYYTSQKGNDVFNCKECGHTFVVTQGKDNMNYCPNCGCRMFEPQESEEISERNMKMWEEIFNAERSDKK